MSGLIDPSDLPRWYLLVLLGVGIPMAVSQGFLDPNYMVFGSMIRTMDVAGAVFGFGALMGIIAYVKWI